MATFGDRLHELRTAYKLSLYQLADILRLSEVAVWQWEQNIAFPRAKNLKKLCDYFNVSIDYLYGFSDRKNSIESEISTNISILSNNLNSNNTDTMTRNEISNANDDEEKNRNKSSFLENCIYLDKVLSDEDKNILMSVAKYMINKSNCNENT